MPSGYAFNPNATSPFWRQLIPYFDTYANAQAFASNPIVGNLNGYQGPVPGAPGNVFDYLGQLLDESNAGATKFSPPPWKNYNMVSPTPTQSQSQSQSQLKSPLSTTPLKPAAQRQTQPITPLPSYRKFQPERDYQPFPAYNSGSRFRTQLR